ncbi:hypothetical protein BDZ89DRAFT_1036631 [Hymenopellis radicata]|nr:hypothetical protein BDZ89DRAFT_1036631 [Hymenopellis radicata]
MLVNGNEDDERSDFGGFESPKIAILAAKIRGFEAKMVKSPADFADLRGSAGVHTKFWHHAMLEFRGVLLSSCTERTVRLAYGRQVEEWTLLLDVVVGECATIFELLASEDQALLVRRRILACPKGR